MLPLASLPAEDVPIGSALEEPDQPILTRAVLGIALFLATCLYPLLTLATPFIAVREAQNCDGCHTPGRAQRPVLERRCTLDCQGCHIDPNGSGPRNQWGAYYQHEQMATVNFFKPQDPLRDESRFDVHFDTRYLSHQQAGKRRSFPMNSELSLRLRPFVQHLHLTYQLGLLGRPSSHALPGQTSGSWRYQERFALMLDNLPLNMYLRAFRGTPVYGQRRSNHSAWIRERVGLNQFALTDGLSVGGTPNVPFLHYSTMLGDPTAPLEDRQKGVSFHGGLRGVSYGWNAHSSFWRTRSQKVAIDMSAISGGIDLGGLIAMAERNWRRVSTLPLGAGELATLRSIAPDVHPSSVIEEFSLSYAGWRGFQIGLVTEKLTDAERRSQRRSLVVDLHPIPYLQLEFWRRFETGTRRSIDSLALVHVYGDF